MLPDNRIMLDEHNNSSRGNILDNNLHNNRMLSNKVNNSNNRITLDNNNLRNSPQENHLVLHSTWLLSLVILLFDVVLCSFSASFQVLLALLILISSTLFTF